MASCETRLLKAVKHLSTSRCNSEQPACHKLPHNKLCTRKIIFILQVHSALPCALCYLLAQYTCTCAAKSSEFCDVRQGTVTRMMRVSMQTVLEHWAHGWEAIKAAQKLGPIEHANRDVHLANICTWRMQYITRSCSRLLGLYQDSHVDGRAVADRKQQAGMCNGAIIVVSPERP